MSRLIEIYKKNISSEMMSKFSYKNIHEIPKIKTRWRAIEIMNDLLNVKERLLIFFDIDDIELIVLENILKSDSYLFDLKFLLRR